MKRKKKAKRATNKRGRMQKHHLVISFKRQEGSKVNEDVQEESTVSV